MIVREQASAILSSYSQYVKAVGSLSLEEYISPTSKRDIGRFRTQHFEYHHLLKHYIDLFGEDNVFCIPFEILVHEPKDFVKDILHFVGVKKVRIDKIVHQMDYKVANSSPYYKQLSLKRYFNPFITPHQKYAGKTFNFRATSFLFRFFKSKYKAYDHRQSKQY